MSIFRWFKGRAAAMTAAEIEEWEVIKAELRRRAQSPVPSSRNLRAEAMRIRMASGVRYPREEDEVSHFDDVTKG